MSIEVSHKGKKHFFYTIEEAKEKSIHYDDNWRKGELDDWVLSDNDYVCQVLKRYEWFQKGGNKHIVIGFANGHYHISPSVKFIAQAKKRFGFGKSGIRGTRVTKDVRHFIDLLIKTGNVKFSFDVALAHRKTKYKLQTILINLLTKESYKKVFSERLENALKDNAITPEYLLKAGKEKLDDSKCKGKEWFQIWETMLKMSGLLGEDSKNRLPESSSGAFFGEQIDGDNGKKKQLLPENEIPVEKIEEEEQ